VCLIAPLALGLSIQDIDFETLRYPLDPATRDLLHKAGLITSQPDTEIEAPFVVTPFGVFGRECVHGTDPGAKVTETKEGDLLIEFKNGTSYVYPSSRFHCRERFARENLPSSQRRSNGSSPAPLDGWLDNGWFFSPGEVGSFTSDYTVPQSPPTQGAQVLFWFIGIESQNNDLTILQPVLTWNNIVPGWSFASWYCCPAGTPNHATPVQGFGPGDILQGTIQADSATSGSDFTVNSCVSGNCAPLSCPADGRIFTSVDTTLETYSVGGDCSEFAPGPMTFSSMALTEIDGSGITPQWTQVTGPTECGGSIEFNGDSCVITHS